MNRTDIDRLTADLIRTTVVIKRIYRHGAVPSEEIAQRLTERAGDLAGQIRRDAREMQQRETEQEVPA